MGRIMFLICLLFLFALVSAEMIHVLANSVWSLTVLNKTINLGQKRVLEKFEIGKIKVDNIGDSSWLSFRWTNSTGMVMSKVVLSVSDPDNIEVPEWKLTAPTEMINLTKSNGFSKIGNYTISMIVKDVGTVDSYLQFNCNLCNVTQDGATYFLNATGG